ncbi:MAG: ADP-ribose-binding protein [Clostridium cochlearium]|uniref:ADP-ribose-binding protein n=1 Tax=Clostridium cochlearium TaxID=1494 RepID=UPI001C0EFEFB|nr:ADP-ribose-binding protein [Clostridium cochlearium]MBU5269518.1 ADP-ribose-binding protein [Clostridium cochlearium]MDU1443048.1 ADP-ribose-binding protein [Clostridium cochlearium]
MGNNNLDKISIIKGDITKENVDAIVNAANSRLLGGGGVDGAIHSVGGSEILKECKKIINKIGKLETGKAVITSGGNLKAKYVIHTVGPIWRGGNYNEETLLANCYINSLNLALEKGIKTIAFPNISTGVYGFPQDLAVEIVFNTMKENIGKYKEIKEIKFVCFDDWNYKLYLKKFS